MLKPLIAVVAILGSLVPAFAFDRESAVIHLNSAAALYFDQNQFQELMDTSLEESPEIVAQKINNFFSSTPLTVQGNGQFFMEDFSGKKEYVTLNERSSQHAHYIFSLRLNPNQNFARGYILAIAKAADDLFKAIQDAVEISKSLNAVQIEYRNFYTCLENVAISVNPKVLGCLDSSIRQMGFKKPEDALYLANVYMKLYRMSRFTFRAISVTEKTIWSRDRKFSFPSKDYTRHYQPIDLSDPELTNACALMNTNFRKIMLYKMSFTKTELPTVGLSYFRWQYQGGKEEAMKLLKLSYAVPEVRHLLGPYFDTVSAPGSQVSNSFEQQEKLCKEWEIYRGTM